MGALDAFDVLIVGGGPAGSVAATVLARAGVRVLIVDRARFPREKLCGDSLNPGALALLRRLGMVSDIERCGLPIDGMLVTGEGGVAIDGLYPAGLVGRSISRTALDWSLLQQATAAGAALETGVAVRHAIVEGTSVAGVATGTNGTEHALRARVTIAADGRRSVLAFGLGLARQPPRPRRWAIGAYMTDVTGTSSRGEMHIRLGRYIGVAPLPGGLTNVCLVVPVSGVSGGNGASDFANPEALLRAELARDERLRDRFSSARLARPPIVLGPLAVDATGAQLDGLLLAGDASGFVDPMTGDGMRFAIRGGELAAESALEALEHGWSGVHTRLAERRRHEFSGKWRFNRSLRILVGSPRALSFAAPAARLVPSVVQAIIRKAGDCSETIRVR